MKISKEKFQNHSYPKTIFHYTLINNNGMALQLTNFGGIVTSLKVPDKNNCFDDILLGFDSLSGYFKDHPYFGAVVGRYANRINKGRFYIDDVLIQLSVNNNGNHLHGGFKGIDGVIWDSEIIENNDAIGVRLFYFSKAGEEGYPGNLAITVEYELSLISNRYKITYFGETDKPTPVNLTQHNYFNLKGTGEGDTLDHILSVNANHYTPVNDDLIPTGEIKSIKNTPLDFSKPTPIGERINQLQGGYDHNFVLNEWGSTLKIAATVLEPTSGRKMEIWTTQPGMQFYTGNFLDGTIVGKNGVAYQKHAGFCLETQHFPDSPNNRNFPSTILRPGQVYSHSTIYKFSTLSSIPRDRDK